MKSDEFIGQVQNRARLGSIGESLRAIRAVLETLGERIDGGEAKDLAAQLPPELGAFLQTAEHRKRMTLEEFFHTVAERESVDLPDAVYHIRVVLEILQEAVSAGEINDVIAELPPDWAPLFESSQGEMRIPASMR